MRRTIVYIDGFNFYYGCIRHTPYRWLDLLGFSQAMLPKNDVVLVKYFTAVVKPTDGEAKRIRQLTYLRALATLPRVRVYLGSFQSHVVHRPLADGKGSAEIIDTKEKGSDVNLATELLVDGFCDAYEVAVVISNDSDLTAPIRAVRNSLQNRSGSSIRIPFSRSSSGNARAASRRFGPGRCETNNFHPSSWTPRAKSTSRFDGDNRHHSSRR